MGWSETYYRDYEAQTRLAWEKRAQQIIEELDLFLIQARSDAQLLGLKMACYDDLIERFHYLLKQDFRI